MIKDGTGVFIWKRDSLTGKNMRPGVSRLLKLCVLGEFYARFSQDAQVNETLLFVQNGFWTLWGHTPWPCPQGLHQNSAKCVPPVLIHRAITFDSFKVLAQKAKEELCDNQNKRTQNPTFLPLVTLRHSPLA